jgi:hypothetical protein
MDFLPQFKDNVDQSTDDPNLAAINLKRKLALAESLRNTKMPQGQMVGDRYVAPSWTQYLAGAVNQGMAGYNENKAMKEYGDYQKTKSAQLGDVLKSLKTHQEDVPLDTTQTGGSPGMWETQTVKPDINTTIALMNKYDPNFGAKIAETSISKALTPKEAIKMSAGEILLDPNTNQPLYTAPPKNEPGTLQKDFEYAKSQGYPGSIQDWKKVSEHTTPYFQAVPTEQGYARFNARTGQIEQMPINGKTVLPAAQSPALQGQIAGARTGSEAQAKREFNMTGASNVIDQAEQILTGQTKPTASGIGALADVAGSVIGYAPRGAAQADQLKAIGGQLVSKMPRMEGPQSDRDVQLYTQMAGQIGDATIPISRRLAALQTVKSIVKKYEPMNQPSQLPQPNAQPNQPKTIRFEDLQ